MPQTKPGFVISLVSPDGIAEASQGPARIRLRAGVRVTARVRLRDTGYRIQDLSCSMPQSWRGANEVQGQLQGMARVTVRVRVGV